MKIVLIIVLSIMALGCSGNATVKKNRDTVKETQKEESSFSKDTFKIDPLSKIQIFDVPSYYNSVFNRLRGMLEDQYSKNMYVSKPKAYMLDGKVMAIAPWAPTAVKYTVFPSAHYLVVRDDRGEKPETKQYKLEVVLKALKVKYAVNES